MIKVIYRPAVGSSRCGVTRRLLASLTTIVLSGCGQHLPLVHNHTATAPSPNIPWQVETAKQKPLVQPKLPVPLERVQPLWSSLTLAEIVDIALQNNPDTHTAWCNARAAAAGYGAARGAWLPSINLNSAMVRNGEEPSAETNQASWATTTYSGSADLSYLLFDFGARAAGVEEAKQALYAANWTHNAVIQNTVLAVQTAYYEHAGAKAMLEANRSSLANAVENFKAAQEKHNVGIATTADVLQAQTAYSEALLQVQNSEGQVRISRGALALAMGFPANQAGEFQITIPEIPADTLIQNLDQMIVRAMADRPDLLAARANAFQSAANAKQARSALLPTLSASGSIGRLTLHSVDGHTDNYRGSISLSLPLFNGFTRQYNYARAKAEADAALHKARSKEQNVIFQVYAAYCDFQTAGSRIKTTNALLASAGQSAEVALGRYKHGVGTILDLLSAQRSLALARAEQIQARLDWHLSLAQLAYDMGVLGVHGENPLTSASLK
jgi:outer membrane protein